MLTFWVERGMKRVFGAFGKIIQEKIGGVGRGVGIDERVAASRQDGRVGLHGDEK